MMSWLPFSPLWLAGAVLLFWGVGAYNRLVRLRAEANQAFAQLQAELARLAAHAGECLPPLAPGEGGTIGARDFDGPAGESGSIWGGLQGAAQQVSTSLAAAGRKPLDPPGIAALAAARGVLDMAWERAVQDDAHDLAGARLPEPLIAGRAQIASQAATAADQFNAAIARYNHAVRQFPALILAWLFGFRPAYAL